MKLYNLKKPTEEINFCNAVQKGLGSNQGLFFPKHFNAYSKEKIEKLLQQDFILRSANILSDLIADEVEYEKIFTWIKNAFTFRAPLIPVLDNIHALELFHGPTLAFKDFGGRFMAQVLRDAMKSSTNKKITILTATSGDTGAAVAHAFYNIDNIDVVILYPKGKISNLQEKLFCTLGKNITTIAVDSDFDDCQKLVKQAFDDKDLATQIGLNSANSINISRLLAQICYYFEAVAQLEQVDKNNIVVAVPSGNFGNLTAGLLAKVLGLPIKRFIAATNENDTVPRYLLSGQWNVKPTVSTLSNAMDVSNPNNWARIEFLLQNKFINPQDIIGSKIDEQTTIESVKLLNQAGYLSEPHGAVAYAALKKGLSPDEIGIFLATAHPAKFDTVVEDILQKKIALPQVLAESLQKTSLSLNMRNNFADLRELLLKN